MLKIEDIHTYYGDTYILQGLNLEVGPDIIVGVVGRNGMGKTTMIRSVMGFNPPRSGRIIYNGVDLTRMKTYNIVRRGISLVPQAKWIFQSLSVEENLKVAFFRANDGWNFEKVYELFPPLQDRRKQKGGSLSGGEQQMLAIGRALMTNPSLLFLDEPTQGLSPIYVKIVGKVIQELNKSGISILFVEQKIGFVLKYANYMHIISRGKIVFSSSPAEFEQNQEVRFRYLGV